MAVIEWSWKWAPGEVEAILLKSRRHHLANTAMLDLFGAPDMFSYVVEGVYVGHGSYHKRVHLTKIFGSGSVFEHEPPT